MRSSHHGGRFRPRLQATLFQYGGKGDRGMSCMTSHSWPSCSSRVGTGSCPRGAALISDFGIARALGDATLTSGGMIHGTPAYLAPEVARGSEENFASDVFSLGSMLYSALEGRPPFGTDDNTMALLHRVASGQFPPPQHSGPLTSVIMHMLPIDTDERPAMGAVADGLARLAKGRFDEEALTLAASDEWPKEEETTPAAYSGHDAQQATGPSPAAAPKSPA